MKNLKHEKEYIIRSYEADKNSNLRLVTLFNMFQDMADEHAEKLGLGLSFCITRDIAWVGSNYHIKIDRMPKLHEKIKIITWPSAQKKVAAVRDFAVYDEDDNIIITASSVWVLIDILRKRPISLSATLPEYSIHPERSIDTDFPKLPSISEIGYLKGFHIRFDDIDINNHVNNAIYPLWASESITPEHRVNLFIKEIEVEFKKEGFYGEEVLVNTEMLNKTSIHQIFSKNDDRELSRVRIVWG